MDGTDIYSLDETKLAIFRRRQVGLIYQFYNLIPVLDVEENITLPLLLDGRKPDKAQLDELLSLLGLSERRHHLPNQLSGGQQQRVSIGRALVSSPALMLADEPTGNLDSRNSADIMTLLRMSNQKYGQTLLLITHDMDTALQADRIIGIEDGRIVRDEVAAQMNVMRSFTLRNLRRNKKRTVLTIVGVVISVAMITAASALLSSFISFMQRSAIADTGNWPCGVYQYACGKRAGACSG